jgi:hypothetical protein
VDTFVHSRCSAQSVPDCCERKRPHCIHLRRVGLNTILCVLKSGVFKPWTQKPYTIEYGPHHVQWLRDQFAAKLSAPHQFICLTDMEIPGVETRPLLDNLPGWWSKMELFRDFTDAAYVDLDTVVLGDASEHLFCGHKFTMAAHMTKRHGVNSSVMAWKGDYHFLYEKFIADKNRFMKEFVVTGRWGDQDFIKENLTAMRGPIDKFSHRYPDFIASYRHDILNRGVPVRIGGRRRIRLRSGWEREPHIVAFHGSPKPYAVDAPWIPKLQVPELCAA